MSLPINFLLFTVSEILPDKILKVKVTTARSKVKSRSYHDDKHPQPPTSVTTKYQLPTPYGCEIMPGQDIIGQGHFFFFYILSLYALYINTYIF